MERFNALPFAQRCERVGREGKCVAVSPDRSTTYYSMGDFFARVTINPAGHVGEISSYRDGPLYKEMMSHVEAGRCPPDHAPPQHEWTSGPG
jgi:hypothetical protein